MIFDQYEATNTTDDRPMEFDPIERVATEQTTKSSAIEPLVPKKRVAHENVNRQQPSLPTFKQSRNHMQNAMQVHAHKLSLLSRN